jgi:hypothetical protein
MIDRLLRPAGLALALVLVLMRAGALPAAAAETTFDFAIGVDHCDPDGSPQVYEPTVALPTDVGPVPAGVHAVRMRAVGQPPTT